MELFQFVFSGQQIKEEAEVHSILSYIHQANNHMSRLWYRLVLSVSSFVFGDWMLNLNKCRELWSGSRSAALSVSFMNIFTKVISSYNW